MGNRKNRAKQSFLLYHDSRDLFAKLSPEDCQTLILGLFDYSMEQERAVCTFDMKKQAEVRDILWKFDISYEMRVSDRADFFVSGRTTSTDADIDHQTEYLIYVRKEDYDRAMFLVQRNLKE